MDRVRAPTSPRATQSSDFRYMNFVLYGLDDGELFPKKCFTIFERCSFQKKSVSTSNFGEGT